MASGCADLSLLTKGEGRAENQLLAVSWPQLAEMKYALSVCYKNGIRSPLDLLPT